MTYDIAIAFENKFLQQQPKQLPSKNCIQLKPAHLNKPCNENNSLATKPFSGASGNLETKNVMELKLAHLNNQCNDNIGFAAKPASREAKL